MRTLPFFLDELGKAIPAARQQKHTTAQSGMIMIYWKIGQRIVEKEQKGNYRAEYGTYIAKYFSKLLSKEFGSNFSVTNIRYFRQFYIAFPEKSIHESLRKELSWTHYRIIMKVNDPETRRYYIAEAAERHWSTRQLEQKIKNKNLEIMPPPSPAPPKMTTAEIIQSIVMKLFPQTTAWPPKAAVPSDKQE